MPDRALPCLLPVLLLLLQLLVLLPLAPAALAPAACRRDEDCGWRSSCNGSHCACPANFTLHGNGRDCRRNICEESDCVECSSHQCIRCVYFISRTSHLCMQRCNGEAEIALTGPLLGNICTEAAGDGTDIVVAVVAGVAAGVLLCVIITLGVVFYLRRTRKNVNLQQTNYNAKEMEMGNVKQIPGYDNKAFEPDGGAGYHAGVVDPAVYQRELEALRPHMETLMTVLAQIRRKLRAMEATDPRVSTYKGVIHQLCRVLVLLHRKESSSSIPSDSLGLIEWAQQMLEDHREQEELEHGSSVGASEVPISRISYVDVDFDASGNPHVYAIPGNTFEQRLADSGQTSGYYSSVPVPGIEPGAEGYATIRRTPSNPTTREIQPSAAKAASGSKKARGKKGNIVQDLGYFANGRYYDPNPDPTVNTEVYAPASSYSDRSAGPLMTFQADSVPRSESFSDTSTAPSRTGEDAGDDEMSDENDVFPFDPQDATDPVEV